MPHVKLTTNRPLAPAAQESLKSALGDAITALGKTENWLMVEFAPECPLYFKGTDAPAAILSVDLFGAAAASAYDAFTAKATAVVAGGANVPADRVFIKYAEYTHWGWNGSNF